MVKLKSNASAQDLIDFLIANFSPDERKNPIVIGDRDNFYYEIKGISIHTIKYGEIVEKNGTKCICIEAD